MELKDFEDSVGEAREKREAVVVVFDNLLLLLTLLLLLLLLGLQSTVVTRWKLK